MAENAPRDGFTVLYNPATGDPWECPTVAVPDWTALGWTRAPKSAPKDVK